MFDFPANVRVNTVNCVGVMGRGMALVFKNKYPCMFHEYRTACRKNQVVVGKMFTYRQSEREWIVNFPTKKHWRNPSCHEYIDAGLADLRKFLFRFTENDGCTLPALGCGNGGLDWNEVSRKIVMQLSDLAIDIFVFAPGNYLTNNP